MKLYESVRDNALFKKCPSLSFFAISLARVFICARSSLDKVWNMSLISDRELMAMPTPFYQEGVLAHAQGSSIDDVRQEFLWDCRNLLLFLVEGF